MKGFLEKFIECEKNGIAIPESQAGLCDFHCDLHECVCNSDTCNEIKDGNA